MKKKIFTRITIAFFLVCFFVILIAGVPLMYDENKLPRKTEDEPSPVTEQMSQTENTQSDNTEQGITEDAMTECPDTAEKAKTPTPTPTPTPTQTPSVTPTPIPDNTTEVPPTEPSQTEEPLPTLTQTPDVEDEFMITVYLESENKYKDLPIEDYITGVVLAEMSYQYPVEALKAQAVAARTYCLRGMFKNGNGHSDAAVCNRASHCMAYLSYDEILIRYGDKKGDEIWHSVKKIVLSTKGEYLTYNDAVICAMFHDSSAGCTESAENLYGDPKPYLVCVKTPETVTEYRQTVLTAQAIKKLFEVTSDIGDISKPIGKVEYYVDSGRCRSIEIFGKKFSALQVFIALGLRSMDFEVSYENNSFIFICKGYGHGLGMSQKGAKVYAEAGLDYREILLHYYKNCEIKSFDVDGIPV